MSDTSQTVLLSLRRFLSGTLVSRFSGLLREVVMAFAFGTSPAVASFWMAFRFAHLFRRLFGEGGLNIAFIPHFEDLKQKNPPQAAHFFHHLSTTLTWILVGVVLLGEAVLGSFYYFSAVSADSKEVLFLTMLLLPSLIFLSLYALNSALLNSEKSYFLPSAAPAVVNFIWVAVAFSLRHLLPATAMPLVAIAVVLAFAGQWLVTQIPAYKHVKPLLTQRSPKERLLPFLRPFFLAILGVTAQQINSAIDTLFAKAADPEGPALLWYALRLQQLPFALLGVGMMNALLPPLARSTAQVDVEKYTHLLNFSLKKIVLLMIPLSCAIGAGGYSSINLLYGRGAFSVEAVEKTTACLWAYGAGLLPMGVTLLLASAFFAMKNYKIPTLFSCASLGLNAFLNALFIYGLDLGVTSIALATTLASIFNALGLGYFLAKKRPGFAKGLVSLGSRILIAGLVATFATQNLQGFFTVSRHFNHQLLAVLRDGISFLSFFLLTAWVLKIKEVKEIAQLVRKKHTSSPRD